MALTLMKKNDALYLDKKLLMQQIFQSILFPSSIENTTLLCFFKEELTKEEGSIRKFKFIPFAFTSEICFDAFYDAY